MYYNKILGILTTIFNLRLGYWILNPKKNKLYDSLVWWPRYFIYELLGMIGIENEMLNISDGGHIENLGIYELLRRRCKLIIAVDAAADPKFTFSEIGNLAIRARNELGIEIRFSKNYLEEEIRPTPSVGYSNRRFAVAEIYHLWEELMLEDENNKIIFGKNKKPIEVLINYKKYDKNPDREEAIRELLAKVEIQIKRKVSSEKLAKEALKNIEVVVRERLEKDLKIGTLVYVKSSVTPPQGKPSIDREKDPLRYYTYKYKIYHPEFPHESTADQFFDPVQWTAYYELGRFIGADVLGIDNLDEYLRAMNKHLEEEASITDQKEPMEKPEETIIEGLPDNPLDVNINNLIQRRFGRRTKIFEEIKQNWEQERKRKEKQEKQKLEEAQEQMPEEIAPTLERSAPSTLEELIPEELEPAEAEAMAAPAPEDEFTGEKEGEELPSPQELPQQQEVDKIVIGDEDVGYKM